MQNDFRVQERNGIHAWDASDTHGWTKDIGCKAPLGTSNTKNHNEHDEHPVLLDIETPVHGNNRKEVRLVTDVQELHQVLSTGLVRLEALHREHLTQQKELLRQWCGSKHSGPETALSSEAVKGLVPSMMPARKTGMVNSMDWSAPGAVTCPASPPSSPSSVKRTTQQRSRSAPHGQWIASGTSRACALVPAPCSSDQDQGRAQSILCASSRCSSPQSPQGAPTEDGYSSEKRRLCSPSPVSEKVQLDSSEAQQSENRRSAYRETLNLIDQVLGWFEEKEPVSRSRQSSPCRDWVTWIVNHYIFRAIVSLMIILNSMTIGLSMQFLISEQVKTPGHRVSSAGWMIIENMFCVFFMFELGLRAMSESVGFVQGPNWKWNMFDLALVAMCVSDFILENSGKSIAPNIGYARMFRLVRLARILRIIRVVRLFHSLRLMIISIIHCAGDLLWVLLLLFLVIYSFAIVFLTGVMEHLESNTSPSMDAVENFIDLPRALLSLFMAVSGGIDWQDVIFPLFKMGTFYGLTFFVYIFFVTFGVLNVVTSMFVDSAFQVSSRDREALVQGQLSKDLEYQNNIKEFFFQADKDNSGSLSWEEFDEYLSDPKVQAYFKSLELDVSQAKALFKLMDVDDTNSVGITEFLDGCMRLRGSAKSIDVNMLLYENEQMISKWALFMEKTEQTLEHVQKHLGIDIKYKKRVSNNKGQCRLSNALRLLDST